MTNVAEHPLTQMISLYCQQYESLREANLDLGHQSFHRRFGLGVQAPDGWGVLDSVKHVIDGCKDKQVVVIFSSTKAYQLIRMKLGDDVKYISWHEIYTGMHVAHSDARYIQRVKGLLDANLVFFIDPPMIPEVLDQVRGQTTGGLVVLSGSGLPE